MEIKYKQKPVRYKLTPSRKYIGKSLARGKPKAIAQKCWKNPKMCSYLLACIGSTLQKEITLLCSDSMTSLLRKTEKSELSTFKWNTFITELEKHAPILLKVLRSCTKTRVQKKNVNSVIGMCAAMILKHRRASMSAVQKIISLILYASHSSKKVIITYNFCV